MKSKALIAMAVAGLWSTGTLADQPFPADANEMPPAMSTILSLDNQTGGYKGWGPMPNPQTPSAAEDSTSPLAQIDKEREYKQHLAEVNAAREQVWVANAPLRSEYDNIGATRNRGTGFGRFFSK